MYHQQQKQMLIFRVPEEIADEVGQLVLPPELPEKDKVPWARGVGAGGAGDAQAPSDKVVLEVQPDVDHNYKNPSAPDRFIVNLQGKTYPGKQVLGMRLLLTLCMQHAMSYGQICWQRVLIPAPPLPTHTAMLLNLPAPVEAQRMFERHNVLKSGDIGQVLQLFNTVEELQVAQALVKSPISRPTMNDQDRQFSATLSSGITSATANITKKRYELTRRELQTPTFHAVKTLNEEIANTLATTKVDLSEAHADPEGEKTADTVVQTSVEYEVVDYADWMSNDDQPDGVKIVIKRKMEQHGLLDEEKGENLQLVQLYPDIVLGDVAKAGAASGEQADAAQAGAANANAPAAA